MTLFHSETRSEPAPRRLIFAAVAIAAVLAPLAPVVGALITTDRYIVRAEETVTEDQYVVASSIVVEGTIDANLTVFSGDVIILGTVTGDVQTLSAGTVTVADTGSVGGALEGAAVSLSMRGDVGTDVFMTAGSIVIEDEGVVGRDVIGFGGTFRIEGTVGRDVRGRALRTTVDGSVGGDVDVASQSLSIGPTAVIEGDLLYRSESNAAISQDAVIEGTVSRLPTQSNFIYSLILSIATVVGFLGFVVVGLLTLWLIRGTSARAVGSILTNPIKSFFVGLATVVVFPLAVGFVAITLVGIPLAAVLFALGVIGFVLGPIPAVTALGNRILFRRGGMFGAFVLGAVLWRLGIWLIPVVGGALFVIGLVWGVGGWVLGAVAARRAEPIPPALLPPMVVTDSSAPPEWEPPKAPVSSAAVAAAAIVDGDDHEGVEAAGPSEVLDEAPDQTEPREEKSEPDPSLERDRSTEDASITFGGADATDAEESDEASLSDRFEALREELRSTGTVEPVAEPEPDDNPGDDSGDDPGSRDAWGLPSS